MSFEWLQKATLKELVDQVIWESIMEGTAHCGWTNRAREGLVKETQESVEWAIAQKNIKYQKAIDALKTLAQIYKSDLAEKTLEELGETSSISNK